MTIVCVLGLHDMCTGTVCVLGLHDTCAGTVCVLGLHDTCTGAVCVLDLHDTCIGTLCVLGLHDTCTGTVCVLGLHDTCTGTVCVLGLHDTCTGTVCVLGLHDTCTGTVCVLGLQYMIHVQRQGLFPHSSHPNTQPEGCDSTYDSHFLQTTPQLPSIHSVIGLLKVNKTCQYPSFSHCFDLTQQHQSQQLVPASPPFSKPSLFFSHQIPLSNHVPQLSLYDATHCLVHHRH